MKPRKMKAYPSFAAWKRDQSPGNQRLINALVRIVRLELPDLEPGVKWGQGCWTRDGDPTVYIHAEPDHVQFGFFAGSTLKDPDGLLAGSGKHVRHVKVYTTRGIPREGLEHLLAQVR